MVTIIGHTDLTYNYQMQKSVTYPDFLSPTLANSFFEDLTNHHTPWRQDPITVFGKTHPQPRLTSLHAHTLDSYSYSGIVMTPQTNDGYFATALKKKSINCSDASFTTVLLNLYQRWQRQQWVARRRRT